MLQNTSRLRRFSPAPLKKSDHATPRYTRGWCMVRAPLQNHFYTSFRERCGSQHKGDVHSSIAMLRGRSNRSLAADARFACRRTYKGTLPPFMFGHAADAAFFRTGGRRNLRDASRQKRSFKGDIPAGTETEHATQARPIGTTRTNRPCSALTIADPAMPRKFGSSTTHRAPSALLQLQSKSAWQAV